MAATRRPNSRRNLDIAIDRLCARSGDEPNRIKRLLAAAIVGQLLPDGAVKGGNSLKVRFGKDATRYSRDLDTARASSLVEYTSQLESSLSIGWNGFTGVLIPKRPASPQGVPPAYVMQPYEVKLAYNGKSWMTLPLEVGHNEIGDAERVEPAISKEAAAILSELGFPEPGPIPCIRLDHQIAQKLHALSSPNSERAHDLIDLQIIARQGEIDYAQTRTTCMRLFRYRGEQPWPPVISKGERWETLYTAQAEGLGVLPSVDEAIEWANNFIEQIEGSH